MCLQKSQLPRNIDVAAVKPDGHQISIPTFRLENLQLGGSTIRNFPFRAAQIWGWGGCLTTTESIFFFCRDELDLFVLFGPMRNERRVIVNV